MEWLWETLKTNEFMQGGVVVAILTSLIVYMKSVPNYLWKTFWHYFSTHIVFNQGDKHFKVALHHLIDNHQKSKFGSFFIVDGKKIPAGDRWSFRGWNLIIMGLSQRNLENSNDYRGGAVAYSVNISIFGFNRDSAARQLYDRLKPEEVPLKVYFNDYEKDLPDRSFQSVASPVSKIIEADLSQFKDSKKWYSDRCIPYRRTYLLYGPPGTGKTSMGIAAAQFLKRDLEIVNIKTLSVPELFRVFSNSGRVLVIEDIDVATPKVKDRSTKTEGLGSLADTVGCTLADILNALDGVTTGEDNIIILTTNDVSVLDKALVRPGRVDMMLEMSYMDQDSFDQLGKIYYEDRYESFPVPTKITPARVQQVFLENKNDFSKFREILRAS